MPSGPSNQNLGREEAAGRARTVSVRAYDVELDVSAARDQSVAGYRSRTTIRR